MKFENKTDLGTDECIVKYKSVFKEETIIGYLANL